MKKIKVGVLFGGKSAEHEVSLRSARSIVEAIDKERYEPVLIQIGKDGRWFLSDRPGQNICLAPESCGKITNLEDGGTEGSVDVVFPILHGPFGEDGTVQGLLKLAGVPFVGAGVLGSAVGMDKDFMKRLLREANLPIAKFLVFKEKEVVSYREAVENLGQPFFVKPANLGSSIGVSKVKTEDDFIRAAQEAFKFDAKLLLEEHIEGREIECSVLGNDEPIASLPGEIIPHHEFYSYEAKYTDENGASLEIPARLSNETVKKIQTMAVKAFKTLGCEGLGRVDFFLKRNGDILVNEINTLPGFTSISMFPKLWEATGVSYPALIDRLIQLALERFTEESKIQTFYITA